VIAANIDGFDAGILHLGDECRVVLFTGGVGLVQGFRLPGSIERLAGFVREAFAIGRLVVNDGDLLACIVFGKEIAGNNALGIVTAADTMGVPQAFFGEYRVGRGAADHHDAFLGIDISRRDRRTRTEMASHELDALRHHLVGNRHGLLRIAGIVTDFENEFFAIDSAGGVDVSHRHFGSALQLLTESGILAGDRAGDGDGNVRQGRGGRKRGSKAEGNARQQILLHMVTPLGFMTVRSFGVSSPLAGNIGPKACHWEGPKQANSSFKGPIWPARTVGRTVHRPRDTG